MKMEFGVLRKYFWKKQREDNQSLEGKKKNRDIGLRNMDKLLNLKGIFGTCRIASRIAKQI